MDVGFKRSDDFENEQLHMNNAHTFHYYRCIGPMTKTPPFGGKCRISTNHIPEIYGVQPREYAYTYFGNMCGLTPFPLKLKYIDGADNFVNFSRFNKQSLEVKKKHTDLCSWVLGGVIPPTT